MVKRAPSLATTYDELLILDVTPAGLTLSHFQKLGCSLIRLRLNVNKSHGIDFSLILDILLGFWWKVPCLSLLIDIFVLQAIGIYVSLY